MPNTQSIAFAKSTITAVFRSDTIELKTIKLKIFPHKHHRSYRRSIVYLNDTFLFIFLVLSANKHYTVKASCRKVILFSNYLMSSEESL